MDASLLHKLPSSIRQRLRKHPSFSRVMKWEMRPSPFTLRDRCRPRNEPDGQIHDTATFVGYESGPPMMVATHALDTNRARIAAALMLLVGLSACSGDPVANAANDVASGDRYMANQQFSEALIEYGRAIKARPD